MDSVRKGRARRRQLEIDNAAGERPPPAAVSAKPEKEKEKSCRQTRPIFPIRNLPSGNDGDLRLFRTRKETGSSASLFQQREVLNSGTSHDRPRAPPCFYIKKVKHCFQLDIHLFIPDFRLILSTVHLYAGAISKSSRLLSSLLLPRVCSLAIRIYTRDT
ncbi:uncharacterized [Tachysurus ichikawai]